MNDQGPGPETAGRRRQPTRREAVIAAGVLALALVVTGAVLAVGHRDSGARHPSRASTSTSTSRSTTTSTTTVGTTLPPPPTGAPPATSSPTSNGPTTPTTAAPGSPWPPGTLIGYRMLTGRIDFAPAEAVSGTRISYTATLANPTGQWLFVPQAAAGFSIYPYTPATEESQMTPYIVYGVSGSAPEFLHQTTRGLEIGLLLAPHGSYRFSGRFLNTVESFATGDYVAHADIIFTPPGVANALGLIVRGAGSFTVLLPPAASTTTTAG